MAAKSNSQNQQSRVREALTGGPSVKEKGPPVADGFLSVTPDTPDILEWRSKSLDIAETSSIYLDDDDDGAGRRQPACRWCHAGRERGGRRLHLPPVLARTGRGEGFF